jgi:hypothetical protein
MNDAYERAYSAHAILLNDLEKYKEFLDDQIKKAVSVNNYEREISLRDARDVFLELFGDEI